MEHTILTTYIKKSFPGAQKLHRILKTEGHKVTMKQVRDAIKKHVSYQLHKKQPKKIQSHMVAFTPDQIWQLDLLDMHNYGQQNKGNKWILLGIDVFTRRAFALPMKNKTSEEVLSAFKRIIQEQERQPEKLITDNGSEFINKDFQNFLREKQILHETNEPQYHPTLGMIDRLSRTIKEKIYKTFTNNNTTDWVDSLDNIMDSYNSAPHASIGNIAPADALKHTDDIREMNIQRNVQSDHGFKAGMLVRKRLVKSIFTKGYKQAWGKDTFRIKDIKGVNAILDNDEKVKLNDLQEILEINSEAPIPKESAVTKIDKEVKKARNIRKEGIDTADIIEEKKRQVPPPKPKPEPKPKPISKPKVKPQEFIVKAIHGTQKVKGTTFYITEWDGFPDKKDFTFEPASHLKGNSVFLKWKQQTK
jgi:transposase InsO family protein